MAINATTANNSRRRHIIGKKADARTAWARLSASCSCSDCSASRCGSCNPNSSAVLTRSRKPNRRSNMRAEYNSVRGHSHTNSSAPIPAMSVTPTPSALNCGVSSHGRKRAIIAAINVITRPPIKPRGVHNADCVRRKRRSQPAIKRPSGATSGGNWRGVTGCAENDRRGMLNFAAF